MDYLLLFFSTPVAHAESINDFVSNVDKYIINPIIILLFALALAFFTFGVFEFIANQESEDKKTTGKSHMIWGIVGMTIMMGVWTILGIVLRTFNIDYVNPEQGTVNLPPVTPISNQ